MQPASLVPREDPTTLFTGSGMQPLIPYLLGSDHPAGARLVNSQPCFRAEDIDEVGDNRHTTFFEMLGNWSLGDYFKSAQLPWKFEFLTQVLQLEPHLLYATVFSGAPEYGVPRDDESVALWRELYGGAGIDALSRAAWLDGGRTRSAHLRGIGTADRRHDRRHPRRP